MSREEIKDSEVYKAFRYRIEKAKDEEEEEMLKEALKEFNGLEERAYQRITGGR